MKKIAHVREVEALNGLPSEVINAIRDAVTILDTEYGESRDDDCGDGGYVMILKYKDELERLKDIHIDVETVMPEYADRIQCADGQVFISTLVLLSEDFGVVVIMPIEFLYYTNWANSCILAIRYSFKSREKSFIERIIEMYRFDNDKI